MIYPRISAWLHQLFEHTVLTMDVVRAARSSVAFTSAWVVCLLTGHAAAAVFVATTAQNIAMVDVRGDYRTRLAVLVTKTVIMALSVLAGSLTGHDVVSATLMMGAIALLGGVWRHLSRDYGPNLAVVSGLLFLIATAQPGDWVQSLRLVSWVGLGGAGAIFLQLCGWFIRPQHPLRHTVAESWVAASDLILALRPETVAGTGDFGPQELALRQTVDQTFKLLQAAADKKHSPALLRSLNDATEVAARFGTRTAAFYTTLEPLLARPDFARVEPMLDAALRSFANVARSAALLVITHQPENLIALEVRLRRCHDLIRVLGERLAAGEGTGPDVASAREMLGQIDTLLPEIRAVMSKTVDLGAPQAGFTVRLPDLGELSLRSLSSWINPEPQIDSVLVRYSLRVAVLTMASVAVYLWFHIPRGYWIAFTAIVVLQPDYGSTREKAGQRILGTFAGALVGSLLVWVKLPVPLLLTLTAVTSFCFAYLVKRRYGLAIFFVTLMLVLITDAATKVNLDFTVSRLLSSLAGGGLALFAAQFFWPSWEREKFPQLIAAAVRANRQYLAIIGTRLTEGLPLAGPAIQRKREAERANSRAAASVQRLLSEPARQQKDGERAAALAAYNQRITRALTVLGLHLNQREKLTGHSLAALFQTVATALEQLAAELEAVPPVTPHFTLPPAIITRPANLADGLVYRQLAKVATEVEAMSLAAYW